MRRPRVGPLVGLFDVICVEKVRGDRETYGGSRCGRLRTGRSQQMRIGPVSTAAARYLSSSKASSALAPFWITSTPQHSWDRRSRNKTVHLYAAWRQTHDGTRKIWHKFDRQSSIGYHLRLRFPRSHADSGQDSIRAPSGDGPKHNRYVITDWSSKTRGVRPFLEGLSSTRRQGDTYSRSQGSRRKLGWKLQCAPLIGAVDSSTLGDCG